VRRQQPDIQQQIDRIADGIAAVIRQLASEYDSQKAEPGRTRQGLTLAEAGRRAHVSTWTLWKVWRDGELRTVPTAGAPIRVLVREIRAWQWVDRHRVRR